MMLSFENREQKDNRAHGEIFYQFCDEVADIDFGQAFILIIDLLKDILRESPFLSDSMIDQILDKFIIKLPQFIKNRLSLNIAT